MRFFAVATSQLEVSLNHAGRRKVIGTGNFRSACSMMVCCVSRFERVACAPIVDKYTTLRGRAPAKTELNVAANVRASLKSGDGSKFGGTRTNAPSTSLNACVRAAASLISAVTNWQPSSSQALHLLTSRTTPLAL